ncbi:MAG: amidohydrolase family protein [Candidatus Binatus sp.]
MDTKPLRVLFYTAILAFGATLLAATYSLVSTPAPLSVKQSDFDLEDVTVINPGMDRREHVTVRVKGSTIAAISAFAQSPGRLSPPFAGSFVLPGLIDMHVHHPSKRLQTDVRYFDLLHLAYGVTTVRDCGSVDGSTLELRSQIKEGQFPGPRIFACGRIIDGDPPFWPGATIARNYREGSITVDQFAASGVDCIKVYSNLSADALAGVRTEAKKLHLTLVGHVPISVPIEDAGLDDVQHLTGVPGLPVVAPSGLIDAILAGWDSIDESRIDLVVRSALLHGTAHTPTIIVLEQLLRLQDYRELRNDPAAQLLPRYYREVLWSPGRIAGWTPPALDEVTRNRISKNIRLVVRRMHEAGVTLHVGSDTLNPFVVPGAALHEELANFVESGFTPEQALEAATRGNGASLREPQLGILAAGAPADMIVLSKDPTGDLAALSTIRAVIARGRFYSKSELDNSVDQYRKYFGGWTYDHLMTLIFRLFA